MSRRWEQIVDDTAIEINHLLTEYLKIHEELFKFSIRKLVPIPFIFKATNAKECRDKLNDIAAQINNHRYDITPYQRKHPFVQYLYEYCEALSNTVSLLSDVCHQLYLKIEGIDYKVHEHDQKVETYKRSIPRYTSIAEKLNPLYNSEHFYLINKRRGKSP